jgi:hypothetical protein
MLETQPGNRCLDCDTKLDACTAVEAGTGPGEGDLSVCSKCGALAFFTADLTLRRPTPKEAFELESNFKVQKIVRAVKQASV